MKEEEKWDSEIDLIVTKLSLFGTHIAHHGADGAVKFEQQQQLFIIMFATLV